MKKRFEPFIEIIGDWSVLFLSIYSISFGMFQDNDWYILFGVAVLLGYSILLSMRIEK